MIEVKDILYGAFLENEYLRFLYILVLFYIISKVLVVIVFANINRITKKTKSKTDDIVLKKIKKPAVTFLMLFGIKIALGVLPLKEPVVKTLQQVFNSAVILLVTYVLIAVSTALLVAWGKRWAAKTESSLDDELLPLLEKSVKVALIVLGLMFVLREWNIDISGLLAGMGIAGLALGFAVKDSLSNIFGGISLILDKAFKVGDVVQLEDGSMGAVVDIGLRSTRIRTWDNELLIVPNGQLANGRIQNYKLPDLSARVVVQFGVEYGSDAEKVKKVVKETIKKIDKVILKDSSKPIDVLFMNMGDSALEFVARFWVADFKDKFLTKENAVAEIYKALNKSKIGIPFPTRTIYMKKE